MLLMVNYKQSFFVDLAYKVIFYRYAFVGLLHKFRCLENFYVKTHLNKGGLIAEWNIPCMKLSVMYY